MVKMSVMGKRATPISPRLLKVIDVVTIEHNVNAQLIPNMEYVSAWAGIERPILAYIVQDLTFPVVGPPPASYVNWLTLGATSDFVEKSPDPCALISKVMIGIDWFVALSIAKTNAENECWSFGAEN